MLCSRTMRSHDKIALFIYCDFSKGLNDVPNSFSVQEFTFQTGYLIVAKPFNILDPKWKNAKLPNFLED